MTIFCTKCGATFTNGRDAENCECSSSAASAAYEQEGNIAITVKLHSGLDTHCIEHIQLIEKQLDAALLPVGYARTTTSKGGDFVEFRYWQCAVIG